MPNIRRSVGTDDTHARAKSNQEWHDGNQTENFRQNEVTCRVHSHDIKGINLLGYSHRTQLGSDIGTHFTCENETHDTGRELQEHDFSGGITRNPSRHPWTLDVQVSSGYR